MKELSIGEYKYMYFRDWLPIIRNNKVRGFRSKREPALNSEKINLLWQYLKELYDRLDFADEDMIEPCIYEINKCESEINDFYKKAKNDPLAGI